MFSNIKVVYMLCICYFHHVRWQCVCVTSLRVTFMKDFGGDLLHCWRFILHPSTICTWTQLISSSVSPGLIRTYLRVPQRASFESLHRSVHVHVCVSVCFAALVCRDGGKEWRTERFSRSHVKRNSVLEGWSSSSNKTELETSDRRGVLAHVRARVYQQN